MTRKTAHALGICSVVINAVFWLLVFASSRWKLGFEGDVLVTFSALGFAIVMATIAFFKASRWWGLGIAASLLATVLAELALD